VPLEAQPELFGRDFLGDLGRPGPVDLDLQEIEDVAIQDELDLGIRAGHAVVVPEQFREAVVLEEVLVRIEPAALDTRAQMEIADDEAHELHGG
jgi:hypothetical protein